MLNESRCFLVQDLVTALPLANGHGNITSHFGESSFVQYCSLLNSHGFVVVVARMPPRARAHAHLLMLTAHSADLPLVSQEPSAAEPAA